MKLVAVFRPREGTLRFWNPDGQPIQGIPEWNSADVAGKALAVVIERPEYRRLDPNAREVTAADGKYYTYCGWNELTPDQVPTVAVPYGHGAWQTVGQLRQGQPLEIDGTSYAIEGVESIEMGGMRGAQMREELQARRQTQPGGSTSLRPPAARPPSGRRVQPRGFAFVTMSHGYDPNWAIRLVAVGKDGKEYPMEAAEGLQLASESGTGREARYAMRAVEEVMSGTIRKGDRSMYRQGVKGLTDQDIDHFNLQKRPLAWAHFIGFALQPKGAVAATSSSRAPASESNSPGGVWITLLPRSPIRSMAEYHQALSTTDVQTPERTTSVPFPACDLEIRRAADQQRVAKVALAESRFLPYNLTEQQTRGIGPLPDGDYLVAFSRGGRRCSNVALFRLNSTYDPAKEPTLSLVPLPLEAWQDLPLLGIRAVGPMPIDPLLTNDKVPFPKLVVDGEERDLTTIKWVGLVGPIPAGQQEVRVLDLGHYQPAIDLGRTHTAKAVVGKYESAEVRIPSDDVLGRQWDTATKSLPPLPEPNAVLGGKVTGPDGKPGSGFEISLSAENAAPLVEFVNDEGLFAFHNIVPGRYQLACNPKGMGQPCVVIDTVVIDANRPAMLDLSLEGKYRLAGTVAGEDGKPVSGMDVALVCRDSGMDAEFQNFVQTDGQGRMNLPLRSHKSLISASMVEESEARCRSFPPFRRRWTSS